MKNRFEASGANGNFYGWVEVLEKKKAEKVTHAITHDDYLYNFTEFTVIAYTVGNQPLYNETTRKQDDILKMVERAEKALNNSLNELANSKPIITFKDELKKRGYN